MKVVILAGGLGARISEESHLKPKPMIEIGEKPILWHIMKTFSHYGHNEFIILLGYKGYIIKEYFANYFLHNSDVTIDLKDNSISTNCARTEPWKITLVETGLKTLTGGRIKKIREYIGNERFMLTYGDGVADINIEKLLEFHEHSQKPATVTAVQPSGRFGALNLDKNGDVIEFKEKPNQGNSWINAGFFVLEPEVFDFIEGDVLWEKEPLTRLSQENKLAAYKHSGFWKPMDTMRDKQELEKLWQTPSPPWRIWD